MPEASVDKQHHAFFAKNKVRSTEHRDMPSPAADPVRFQKVSHRLFRRFIATGPYAAHDFGALCCVKDVRH